MGFPKYTEDIEIRREEDLEAKRQREYEMRVQSFINQRFSSNQHGRRAQPVRTQQ